MQGVSTLWRKPPEPRTENLALRALKKIRIRDFHQIRWPPTEILRRDHEVTVNRSHRVVLTSDKLSHR